MATNKINEKSYIGQTIQKFQRRKYAHIYDALNKNNNLYFGKAIRKYGANNFTWKILDKCSSIEKLNELETFYIKFYGTFKNGYNLTTGGENCKCSKETIRKNSESHKGKGIGKENSFYGKHHSEKTKQKISKIMQNKYKGKDHPHLGRKHSEATKQRMKKRGLSKETKQKMSISATGRKHSIKTKQKNAEWHKGKTHSKRTKLKMSKAHSIPIIIKEKYFSSILEASKVLNIGYDAIRYKLNQQQKGYRYAK